MGFMPSFCFAELPLGVISESGSLFIRGLLSTHKRARLGQSKGIGGDPIWGITTREALAKFYADQKPRWSSISAQSGTERSARAFFRASDLAIFVAGSLSDLVSWSGTAIEMRHLNAM
jgi:succinyl-CoA synthetase alpha subunit